MAGQTLWKEGRAGQRQCEQAAGVLAERGTELLPPY